MNKISLVIFLMFSMISAVGQETQSDFVISGPNEIVTIVYDENASSLDSISANLLAEDIYQITGKKPSVITNAANIQGNFIAIGAIKSDFIAQFLRNEMLPSEFHKQKESFVHKTIQNPKSNNDQVLVIAGTDPRGTAYGVFEFSEKIGVSPWYWWADVPVDKKEEIVLNDPDFFSEEPSVEYRGIFLNDEDWGLQPWAAKTFEPEVGDIGPRTYAKIFELLLRLKANTIWPAMHPSTKAFFHYPGNPEMAKMYHIVLGSSHAEPMLRNNVDEWDKEKMGSFNYLSNQENVQQYWEERVKEASNLDAIYTVGMRGIHDSGMEGVEGIEEATANLQNVINDQRAMLAKHNDQKIEEIPQVFTVYKEVLDLYDHGLDLPEDVTIMWTDDNYGYIRRLASEKERARKGGSGVYYHASYWGRPHDYLWLSTTHPGLIREEMMKAYQTGNKKIWILNVGDIKPAEYNMQLFMDMAYDATKFEDPEYVTEHLKSFYSSTFGKDFGSKIANLKMAYYQLAFERKPEFMGWSQTEPTTQTDTTAYSPFYWGDEISKRIKSYNELEENAEEIKQQLASKYQDAFFQLVYYPVKGASFMNKKFLYRDLAIKYQQQKRLEAKENAALSLQYYDSIIEITKNYNKEIANGKWEHMMDMQPRRLPVYSKPEISLKTLEEKSQFPANIAVENQKNSKGLNLPVFYSDFPNEHFFDIFLTQPKELKWKIAKSLDWLILNKKKGKLNNNISSVRITTEVDWEQWKKADKPENAHLQVEIDQKIYILPIKINTSLLSSEKENVFIEMNGVVSMYAENFSSKEVHGEYKWRKLPNLGYSNNLMQALPLDKKPLDTLELQDNAPYLQYNIYTETETENARLILNALPTHPLTSEHSVRIGVQWNNNPIKIVDFKTFGRSEEWKQNVLRNLAIIDLPVEIEKTGHQKLRIYMIDEGVSLDFMYLKLKDVPLPYSLLQETRL
ncbi:glycosyl hydrolase 115 family protein [Salegentibacter sp. F188]|uniref:Glycosyl hydrolase 115 family protein n=1 Tax=Autumnicola patrickiae TaxID=3075591 RepID=A0ABU3DYX1_9FLAO|nr:glycosyl hydrolase 115 family protein [Salegentibacter sp. F188]MDT0688928.1 glycosyl hydrolase 115 family protein [Salegentibacter sp. F188]